MKLVCDRAEMSSAFSLIGFAIPSRSTMPILQNTKINASGKNSIELIGTDLEVGIKHEVKAEVKETGVVVLPTVRLGAILRETSEAKIKIESDNNSAQIVVGNSRYKIVGANPVDYPDFPVFDTKKAFSLNPKGLREMIQKTVFATSPEITRYALTGVLIEVKEKEIRMVGSDGKRLAYIKRKSDQPAIKDRVIIPPKGMHLLSRLIENDEVRLSLNVEESQIKANIKPAKEDHPEIEIFCRLIEGAYPDYEKVIPADCDKKIEFKTAELHSAVRRAAVVTTDKFKAIKLIFKDNKLTVLSRTQEVGEAQVEMDIKYNQAPFEIVFNPDFFLDFLRGLDEESLVLELKDKTSPAVFKAGRDYAYLVMPLTIDL